MAVVVAVLGLPEQRKQADLVAEVGTPLLEQQVILRLLHQVKEILVELVPA